MADATSNPQNDAQTANENAAQASTSSTTKPVVQSPTNGAADQNGDEHVDQVARDNADATAQDSQTEDDALETGTASNDNARAISGANAGVDNANLRAAARGRDQRGKRKPAPTGFNTDVQPQDPDDPAPRKMDSFGNDNPDKPGNRPTMTPDLAEPLRDPANVHMRSGSADTGETTAGLHAAMRATGAANYGLVDPDAETAAQSSAGEDDGVSQVTDAHHALPLLRGKINALHQMIHNIGSVVEAPLHGIESLMAEIQYLLGVVRKQG